MVCYREWRKGTAEPPLNSPTALSRHLRGLRSKGVTEATVSEITGIGRKDLRRIFEGTADSVRTAHAIAILAVDIDDLDSLPESLSIPAKPTWRRLQFMLERGWTERRLVKALEMPLPSKVRVSVVEARRVRDLYLTHFGIRCAICGKPLGFHRLTNPCLKGDPLARRPSGRRPLPVGRLVSLG